MLQNESLDVKNRRYGRERGISNFQKGQNCGFTKTALYKWFHESSVTLRSSGPHAAGAVVRIRHAYLSGSFSEFMKPSDSVFSMRPSHHFGHLTDHSGYLVAL
jgi:hypothetical protein